MTSTDAQTVRELILICEDMRSMLDRWGYPETRRIAEERIAAAEALLPREEAKLTGFYTKHSEHGWQTLGFAWVDKQGDYRQIEGKTLETDPLMAVHFMESFAQGMIKRIRDNVDKR